MSVQCKRTLVVSPYFLKIDLTKFKICYDENSQILVYVHETQPILFFQTLTDLSFLPPKLSTPITFIPKGPILSVAFSIDHRFISVLRSPNSIEVFNLIDPKHTCLKLAVKSKETIIPSGVCWLHSKKEMKDTVVFSPILVVASTKTLFFYDVTLKGTSLIKSVKLAVKTLWCNRLNQLIIAVEAGSSRVYVFTVKEMGVSKLQTLTLSEAPTSSNTFVSTLYRATYLCQYSESRGQLFVFVFSNRDHEFKYFNTVALPHDGPASFSISDNLIMVHYKSLQESCAIDVADIPFDGTSNRSIPSVSRDAVTELILLRADQYSKMSPEEIFAFEKDPSFEKPVEEVIPYHSYEVQITSPSIGLELESTFQKLFVSSLDGRVHGCLDNSGFVQGYAPSISPIVRSQVELGSYITHVDGHLVIGNTFTSLLQLLRQEKRPIRIQFERGISPDDPYAYHGDSPILAIAEEKEWEGCVYSNDISFLHNNVLIDRSTGALLAVRILLLSKEEASLSDIRFLMRRRSRIPVCVGGEWEIEDTPVSRFPRTLLLDVLIKRIPQMIEQGVLNKLFDVLNTEYASLTHRASLNKDLQSYLEKSIINHSTRELNGNIVITQTELLETVLQPLSQSLCENSYQIVLLTYLQSLLHSQIPIQFALNHHLREHLLAASGAKVMRAVSNLTKSGLLAQDLVEAKKQLFQNGGMDCAATELALQTLRREDDYDALLNYYHSQQMLDDMLLLMAKHMTDLKGEFHLWLLNVIKLATILYDEDNDLEHLYRTYHFMKRYCPAVLKDVQYPNRLGGLLEFAEDEMDASGSSLPSKGDSMKQILQTAKETIVKLAFS